MKLLKEVKTYERLQHLMTEVDSVNLALSGDTSEDIAALIEESAPSFAPILIVHLSNQNIVDKESAIATLTELTEALEGIESLELTLAFEPTEAVTNTLYSWVAENVDKNVVLDFRRNPSIMSGDLVSYKGKYGDFSGAKDLKEAFVGLRKELKI